MEQTIKYKVITPETNELEAELNALSKEGGRPISMGVVPLGGGVKGRAVMVLEKGA